MQHNSSHGQLPVAPAGNSPRRHATSVLLQRHQVGLFVTDYPEFFSVKHESISVLYFSQIDLFLVQVSVLLNSPTCDFSCVESVLS